ncbi:unnamed protein product [Agarophyton chilense]
MNDTKTFVSILAALASGVFTGFFLRKAFWGLSENTEGAKSKKEEDGEDSALCVALLIKAMDYSTEKHRDQKRKNSKKHPYICHPVRVAKRLLVDGGVSDISTLVAALLHDTVEDTDATLEEIDELFGAHIAQLVDEVSDDKSLPKEIRKRNQIEHAPHISPEAKAIKLADKLDNLTELVDIAPIGWDEERVVKYFDWAEAVVQGLRGVNSVLERQLDEIFQQKDVAAKAAALR